MCGIVGFNFRDKELLTKMMSSVSHRGPDQKGRAQRQIGCCGQPHCPLQGRICRQRNLGRQAAKTEQAYACSE